MSIYRYWGKAKKDHDGEGADYHLLPYHCLDVAAVAKVWLRLSPSLLQKFSLQAGLPPEQTQAWVLFFVALHDLGKFDIRFQLKASHVCSRIYKDLYQQKGHLSGLDIKNYWHGPAGVYWLYQDWPDRFAGESDDDFLGLEDDNESWQAWLSWLGAVAGHHGSIAEDADRYKSEFVLQPWQINETLSLQLKQDRQEWLETLEQLFLKPADLSLQCDPPTLSDNTLLAGFCSISDWLASGAFEYDEKPPKDLLLWFESRISTAKKVLCDAGICGSHVATGAGVQPLLNQNYQPRQIQCVIDKLPLANSLTLIEASTGSGKTEAALAHAWRLLEAGLADSIVFALPTQATANAMLARVEKAAPLIFAGGVNVVLAHGRARFQQQFIDLKEAVKPQTCQDENEAWVQCAQWLSESKKRVFLGQIGICTVDQVLVSVLPIRHKFVRGFGIGRSVLIIDEVHAYDAYMYGLLEAVLRQQQAAGGSAILLSATLPEHQKVALIKAWSPQAKIVLSEAPEKTPYPLVSSIAGTDYLPLTLNEKDVPQTTTVFCEIEPVSNMLPSDELLSKMIAAAKKGAQVALICNLVDVAQETMKAIRKLAEGKLTDDQLILFHSRYVFSDRQKKEVQVVELFGPKGSRQRGHILISTQVFECSIDADMDWMITQLCPVDLLFQRWGRLHRHSRARPEGYSQPLCTILVPEPGEDYELHSLIYGDSRILWRTQQLLEKAKGRVEFPDAYRTWIEPVYHKGDWGNEPEWVQKSHQDFEDQQLQQRSSARSLINANINNLKDSDANVATMTRDGEMNLTVIPIAINSTGQRCLLDGTVIDSLDDSSRSEKIGLNGLGVPRSWNYHSRSHCSKNKLPDMDDDGYIWLEMQPIEQTLDRVDQQAEWQGAWNGTTYRYSAAEGFRKMSP